MAAWEHTEWKKLDLAGPEEEERVGSFRAQVAEAPTPQPPIRSLTGAQDLRPAIYALEQIATRFSQPPPAPPTPPPPPQAMRRAHEDEGQEGGGRRVWRKRPAPQEEIEEETPSEPREVEQARG